MTCSSTLKLEIAVVCSIGINESSDYLKLIYSDGIEFLSNVHLREKIATKIEMELYDQTNTDVERAIFS